MDVATRVAEPRAPGATGDVRGESRRKRTNWSWAALLVALSTVVGVIIRLIAAHQSLFADELATWWLVTTHGSLPDVVSTVHTNAEITPPLYFVLAWLTTQLGHTAELTRGPSVIAGCLSIPLIFVIGRRLRDETTGVIAAGITALAPFMIYFSSEARNYALMMFLVMLSTLSMLNALDTGRRRWWIAYAAATAGAVYTHYTSVFLLAGQVLWLLMAHPESRKPAILANLGAMVAFAPWTTGALADFRSPTTNILSKLQPFTFHDVRLSLEHWAIGYPYNWVARLPEMPGTVALIALALGLIIALTSITVSLVTPRARQTQARLPRPGSRTVLIVVLAVSVPVGEAIVSSVSTTHLLGVRNLAASWPGFALLLAAVVAASRLPWRIPAAALVLVCFGFGAGQMLTDRYSRPDYQAAADFIDRTARRGDVVIDETVVLSPGPLTGLDASLHRSFPIFRAGGPQESDHPFGYLDPPVTLAQANRKAVAAARSRARIFLVVTVFPQTITGIEQRTARKHFRSPTGYRLVERRGYPGVAGTSVLVFAPRARGSAS